MRIDVTFLQRMRSDVTSLERMRSDVIGRKYCMGAIAAVDAYTFSESIFIVIFHLFYVKIYW